MRLTKKALDKILDSRSLPKKLAALMGVSRVTIWRYLSENSDELTKASVLKVLREELELTDDELLEEIESGVSDVNVQ